MPRPRNKLTDQLSEKLDVTKRQAERVAASVDVAKAAGNTPLATMLELKFRKLKAEVEKLEFQNQILRGKYTSNAAIKEAFIRIAAAVKGELMRLENELPAALAGLTEDEMQKRIRTASDELLNRLSEMQP